MEELVGAATGGGIAAAATVAGTYEKDDADVDGGGDAVAAARSVPEVDPVPHGARNSILTGRTCRRRSPFRGMFRDSTRNPRPCPRPSPSRSRSRSRSPPGAGATPGTGPEPQPAPLPPLSRLGSVCGFAASSGVSTSATGVTRPGGRPAR